MKHDKINFIRPKTQNTDSKWMKINPCFIAIMEKKKLIISPISIFSYVEKYAYTHSYSNGLYETMWIFFFNLVNLTLAHKSKLYLKELSRLESNCNVKSMSGLDKIGTQCRT